MPQHDSALTNSVPWSSGLTGLPSYCAVKLASLSTPLSSSLIAAKETVVEYDIPVSGVTSGLIISHYADPEPSMRHWTVGSPTNATDDWIFLGFASTGTIII